MQAVSRDIALVMPDAQPLGPVMDAIRHAAGEWLEDIRLFDVFRGVPGRPGYEERSLLTDLPRPRPDAD